MMKTNYLMTFLIMLMLLIIYNFITNHIHPTLMIIMMLIYSISISLLMSLWSYTFIYSIMLFLIMVSGLLIIFLYFSSLISNEKNNLSPKILSNSMFMMLLTTSIMIPLNTHFKFMLNINMENNSLMNMNYPMFHNILKIYMYPYNNFTFLSMMYLLISLFSIIKICSMKYSSLRKIT